MGEGYKSLVELLEKKAEKNPDFPLYTFIHRRMMEDKKLSYGQLAEDAQKIARVLREVTSPGECALIFYPPGLEFISAFLGCLFAGVIAVPSYVPTTKELSEKLHHIIKNSGATVVLTTKELVPHISKLKSNEKEFEKIQWVTAEDWMNEREGWRNPAVIKEDIAFLQYTSGSTGKPKGVMITHANLLHNLFVIEKANRLTEQDISVSWLPHYHDMGLIGGILQPLFSSIPVKLMSPFTFLQRPAIWLETITHYRATATVAPNFAYDLCSSKISEEEKNALNLSSLHCAMSGAEPIRKSTIERFIHNFARCGFAPEAFYPCYGLAESTLMVTGGVRKQGVNCHYVDKNRLNQGQVIQCNETHPDSRSVINCGQAIDSCHIAIVDPETLHECPEKTVGEIWVAGKSVAKGYWQLPEETEYCFNAGLPDKPHSFLRTGDLGYVDQGALYVTGRLKDMIIVRGRNYYPHDLEDALHNCHPHLREHCCAIFSVEENDRESLIIVQEIEKDIQELNPQALIKIIRSKLLQAHGIEAEVVVLAGRKSVPKTTSGKIQRLLCKKKYVRGELDIICISKLEGDSPQKSAKGIDAQLREIFNADFNSLDKEKRLSETGLSSVKMGTLHHILSTCTGQDISIEFLLRDPCIEEIMSLLAGTVELPKTLENTPVDLKAEFKEHKNVTPHIRFQPAPMPQRILLTGATGFLGAYLLCELLLHTDWQITCLVQASSLAAGMERLRANMERYGIWDPIFHERIKIVAGNLEKNNLGLFRHDWEYLADTIDLIFHGAAVLNFNYPYQKMMASNVLGTKQLIKLAAHKRLKALHYISTIGYFMSADLAEDAVVSELSELTPEEGIYGGYNQTKWLAEQLVVHARSYNIPTIVYRPSLITGNSQTGHWNHEDVVCRILKGCIELGAIPELEVGFNFVPVDYIARAITRLAMEKPYQPDTYHLTNPQEMDVHQLVKAIEAKGFKMQKVAYPEWVNLVKHNSGLSPLRPFFTEKLLPKDRTLFDLYLHNNKARIDCTYTINQLAKYGVYCGKTEAGLFRRYLDYLIDCGYLPQLTKEETTESECR
ncbi:thioester reductase domain-containing protein [Fluoribacter dumoffii]|uniref:Fatty-acid--CoA ligase fadD21 n=1 Tax=Fluoribacter dumoffii TaxID=463 RepID=A0A377G6G1_9GAMM|nr:thioester reductase domain-containing protein [Fluoribacter dumoffii]KTC92415.1 acyl-CoA synthetase [Fluoribacter dumoffii NY 23]MCW8386991.1 thioester reductase domain-containing protein [Fluoribacter dumoffii]MCW8417506.1 thioester reductase domain-containing protein [Fluoribacter dumoffii]MCW8454652.1 thioester reductase domain-containing protein [Fluoribacter dumoffii]MCW8461270.1 thioester reductase domain-containing protein [Fluoribacter dumoffii]